MEEIKLEPYEVTIVPEALNCRVEPKKSATIQAVIKDKGPYMIYEEALDNENNSWGKLENGGWIKLSFVERKPRIQE